MNALKTSLFLCFLSSLMSWVWLVLVFILLGVPFSWTYDLISLINFGNFSAIFPFIYNAGVRSTDPPCVCY